MQLLEKRYDGLYSMKQHVYGDEIFFLPRPLLPSHPASSPIGAPNIPVFAPDQNCSQITKPIIRE